MFEQNRFSETVLISFRYVQLLTKTKNKNKEINEKIV